MCGDANVLETVAAVRQRYQDFIILRRISPALFAKAAWGPENSG